MLVALCAVALFGVFYWLSRPVPLGWRWLSRGMLLLLLAAMLLPPPVIAEIRLLVAWVFPPGDELSRHQSASYWVHFGLFFGYSLLLMWHRRDLPPWLPAAALLALGAATEALQLWVDGRHGSWLDVMVNSLGVGAAALAVCLRGLLGYRHGG